jgi:HAD superfamily hydrolase (TIGR01509 family)
MKAFIFDMDGVIVDSEPIHSQTKLATFQHYGLRFDASELVHYMGRTSRALFGDAVRRAKRTDLDVGTMIAYKHALYLDLLRHDEAVQPVAGTRELFRALAAAHIPAALASSAGRVVIDAVLEKFGLAGYFQSVLSGADLPAGKPDPAVYLLSAEKLRVRPADCVVLEDAASGVAAAKAAGMFCIAYRNPHSGAQDLSRADMVVDNIGKIDITRL